MKNGSCTCGKSIKRIVTCEEDKGVLALQKCYCMTITTLKNEETPVVGPCLLACRQNSHFEFNATDLNNMTCGPYYRTGVLCSKCIEGYGLPVYSYDLSCVECADYTYNWIRYVAVVYGPLTVFYMAAIVFRITATSGLTICYVTICQMLTVRGLVQWVTSISGDGLHYYQNVSIKVILTLFTIWNLDFFRTIYPSFCLHPNISALHVLLLDYLVAVYPLILILITYSFVKLHDRYTLVVWFCKPLHICFHKFRKEWDIKTSLVASFATFYLLSYVKIVNVTADILKPTYFYNMEEVKSERNFYYNASILYFGEEHLPFALFAITFSFLFNVCPLLLLCLYPCTCFHKCLNKTRCRCHTLHVFMDALLGSFSHRPRERRYFGAMYLILRIVHIQAFLMYDLDTYVTVACCIMLVLIVLIAVFQPYKNPAHSRIDLVLLSAAANVYLATLTRSTYKGLLYGISLVILPSYGLGMMLTTILPQRFIRQSLEHVRKRVLQRVKQRRELGESLPYRLERNESEPLLKPGFVHVQLQ